MSHSKIPARKSFTTAFAGVLLLGQSPTFAQSQSDGTWAEDGYYQDYQLFSSYAREDASREQFVYRFGPVGIGVQLTLPAFGMKVSNVEEGSPADLTGKIKPGQIIESINGRALEKIDPRIILGDILAKAEATDGKVTFMLKDEPEADAESVTVEIPVLGAYSETWPLDCAKSDKIVRGVADWIADNVDPMSALQHDQSLLFLLSTGEEKDLEVARKWVARLVEATENEEALGTIPWAIGYGAPGLCEYYLRTGDESVLPLIQKVADQATRTMYNGGWNHRTIVNFRYGHMNAAGVHVLKFLLLAQECGVDVDEHTLLTSLRHFFRYTGRGNVPYGDGLPERGFVDNGKVGGLAFAMAAAVSLMPDGEDSIYAKARDISAGKGFYSTSWMLHGHTGGGIGEVWRSSAMGLVHEEKPNHFREFLDNRTWHLDLSRRFNGAMTILRDTDYSARYDDEMWGAGYAMTYTVPRRTLRMTGAPPTQYSHTYELPERPWGRPADDAFYSPDPAPTPDGQVLDLEAERLATHASWPLLRKLSDPDVSKDTLRLYLRHPIYAVRQMAGNIIREGDAHDDIILELLTDPDPRARQAGVMSIATDMGQVSGIPAGRITPEMVAHLGKMIADPDEAMWTAQNAMRALSLLPPERIAPHADAIIAWLDDEEWWMQAAAMHALAPIADDPEFARKIIPKVARITATNTVAGVIWPKRTLVDKWSDAEPEIQELAGKAFAEAYRQFPTRMTAPGGIDMQNAVDFIQDYIARSVVDFPGGYDRLFEIGREIMPDEALPHRNLYFRADSEQFGPELADIMPTVILEDVIPEFIGSNLSRLLPQLEWATEQEPRHRDSFAVNVLDDLTRLYRQVGIHDYDWRTHGPERDEIVWEYHSFDGPDTEEMRRTPSMRHLDRQHRAGHMADRRIREARDAIERAEEAEERVRQLRADRSGGNRELERAESNLERAREDAEERRETAFSAIETRDHLMLEGHMPEGLGRWFDPAFDAARAGWKRGKAPFANTDGEAKPVERRCPNNFCACSEPPNTLWENEILFMRTTMNFPVIKPDHRYRFLLGGNIHSHQGGPLIVYINGRAVHQQGGFGGRTRPNPRGFYIDKRTAEEMSGRPVTVAIAAIRPERAYLSAWFEKMKMPEISEADIRIALSRVPMKTSEWQEMQDPDDRDPDADPDRGKFRFNGRFEENLATVGTWEVIDQVNDPDEFQSPRENPEFESAYQSLTFHSRGGTHDPMWIWTDGKLMNLEESEALSIRARTVNGTQYLFVENGGFSEDHPRGWFSPWNVLVRTR